MWSLFMKKEDKPKIKYIISYILNSGRTSGSFELESTSSDIQEVANQVFNKYLKDNHLIVRVNNTAGGVDFIRAADITTLTVIRKEEEKEDGRNDR